MLSTTYDCEDYYYEYYYGHEFEECVDLEGWVDSEGNDCSEYRRTPGYCNGFFIEADGSTYYDYIPDSGITPIDACCICQEWDQCEDDPDYVFPSDSEYGCDYYEM